MNKADFEDWGPYLSYGKDSATEMRIAWKSRYFSTHHYIEWGKTKDCINKIEEDFVWPTRIHMFVLKNLKPQTKYFYKISRVGDESRIFSFTTGIKFGKKSKFEVTIT